MAGETKLAPDHSVAACTWPCTTAGFLGAADKRAVRPRLQQSLKWIAVKTLGGCPSPDVDLMGHASPS